MLQRYNSMQHFILVIMMFAIWKVIGASLSKPHTSESAV